MQMEAMATEGFWSRVRTALTRRAQEPAYGKAAIAAKSGSRRSMSQLVEDEFRACWVSAATRNVSLCVLALEMDHFPEYFNFYGQDAADDCVAQLREVVSALRPRESIPCLRTGRSGFMLILPDMPVLMARELVARIGVAVKNAGLINKESHTGLVTMSAGLAVVNPQGKHERKVLDIATQALRRAQRRGIGQLDVADLRSDNDPRRKAA